MKILSLYNRKGVAWFLSVAFVLMATVSGASWQCLDGHLCPPGCTMQQSGGKVKSSGSVSVPSCCVSHGSSPQVHRSPCALCAAAHASNSQLKARCTSSVCVLRMQAKPDSSLQAMHSPLVLDTASVLLPAPGYVLVPEETAALSFGSARAPPPDQAIVRLFSPRAPPARII